VLMESRGLVLLGSELLCSVLLSQFCNASLYRIRIQLVWEVCLEWKEVRHNGWEGGGGGHLIVGGHGKKMI
jgi:hypothetical protein